jgi:hypothetical protein
MRLGPASRRKLDQRLLFDIGQNKPRPRGVEETGHGRAEAVGRAGH